MKKEGNRSSILTFKLEMGLGKLAIEKPDVCEIFKI